MVERLSRQAIESLPQSVFIVDERLGEQAMFLLLQSVLVVVEQLR